MPTNVLLVAEDNPDEAFLLERALRRAGSRFRMVRVANGDECIAYVKGAGAYRDRVAYPAPNLVLLDLKMPKKDGFGVLEWRQSAPDGSVLPVVVFSSSGLSEDIRRAYRLGANSYVLKPTAPERLEAMVKVLHEWWTGFNATVTPNPA